MPEKDTTKSTPASTPQLDAALEYLDMGFSVIPVKRADKKPYFEWKEFQERYPTQDEIYKWWELYPDANVAIVCGKLSGIFCVDADGPIGIEWMNKSLPRTTVYSQTAKGVHAIFAYPDGPVVIRNNVRLYEEVDIRGEGGYFVAPPSIHATGHTYQWIMKEGGWDELSTYRPASAQISSGGIDLSGVKSSPVNAPVGKGSRNSTLAQLAGKWVGAGLDDDEIGTLAKAWNARNLPPLGDAELKKTIASVRKTHTRNHPTEIITCDLEADVQSCKFQSIPEDLLSPGGILGDFMDYIDRSSAVSHPVFNIAAAISTLGAIAGHRFETETRLKTNIYSIVLGYAGSGKDAPQSAIPNLLLHTDAHRVVGPNVITSEAALLKFVSNPDRGSTICFLDEIGLVMKAIKRPNSSAFEVPTMLMKLFSAVNRPYLKPYATGDDLVVKWHHVGLYGASTPAHFWSGFTRSEAADGFLARILIFESRHERSMAKTAVDTSISSGLVQDLNDIFKQGCEFKDTNLVRQPVPKMVTKSKAASSYFAEWEAGIIAQQNAMQQQDEGIAAIYGRAPEHAHKLALIHALSIGGASIEHVDLPSVQWAIRFMEHQLVHTMEQIKDNIAENEWHAEQQKILKIIKRVATVDRPGATAREIQKFGVKCQPKVFDALIQSMMAAGEIISIEHKPARGPASTIFAIAKEKPA